MAERLIRIGRVSSVNAAAGTVSVTYPDMDDSATATFPVFSFTDEYKMPQVGSSVLVLHLSNGQSAGIVLGRYWNETNAPPVSSGFRKELGDAYGQAFIECQGDEITIHGSKIVLDAEVSVTKDVVAGDEKISLTKHIHKDSVGGDTEKAKM